MVVDSASAVCAVIDGCGGHGLAAELLAAALTSYLRVRTEPVTIEGLEAAIRDAEDQVHDRMRERPQLKGCGATLLVGWLVGAKFLALHVGDCRLYRLRSGTLNQLSTDHTWVAEIITSGELRPEEAESHPLKNVVTRAIGGAVRVPIDLISEAAQPGDTFLLCTDGLWRELSDNTIREALMAFEPEVAIRHLMQIPGLPRPDRRGRCDDTTIAVISVADNAVA